MMKEEKKEQEEKQISKNNKIQTFLSNNPINFIVSEDDEIDLIISRLYLVNNKKNYMKNIFNKLEKHFKNINSEQQNKIIEKNNIQINSILKKICELNNKNINMLELIKEHNSIQIQHFEKATKEIVKMLSNYLIVKDIEINSKLDINCCNVVEMIETKDIKLDDCVAQCHSPAYFIINEENKEEQNKLLLCANVTVFHYKSDSNSK